MDYINEIEKLLLKIPHELQVFFALECVKDVFHLVQEQDKEVTCKAISTTEAWLKGEATENDCRAAAYATHAPTPASYDASTYATHAAFAAASVAAYATHAAASATYATHAAAYATHAAASAAYATHAAAYSAYVAYAKEKDKYSKKYYEMLLVIINEIPRFQKVCVSYD